MRPHYVTAAEDAERIASRVLETTFRGLQVWVPRGRTHAIRVTGHTTLCGIEKRGLTVFDDWPWAREEICDRCEHCLALAPLGSD